MQQLFEQVTFLWNRQAGMFYDCVEAFAGMKIKVELDLDTAVYEDLLAEADGRGVPLSVVIQEMLCVLSTERPLSADEELLDITTERRDVLEAIIEALTAPLDEAENSEDAVS